MTNTRNLIKLYVRAVLLGCALLIPTVNQSGLAQARATVPMPNAYELTILVNSTLSALNHANRTGNYSVLHDLGAPSFKRLNSKIKLGQIFNSHRKRHLDISAALLYAPVFPSSPRIDAQGFLHLVGHMPTEPFHLNFSLIFEKSGGLWRIMAISIAPAVRQQQKMARR